jgi:serine/threonine protein kinase
MYSESKQTQDALYREATLWYGLNDEHVLKLLGACHVGKPMFLVTEDAGDRRSFADFFGAEEKNKQRMWTLFAEAAKGLRFLHEKGIVHGNLKCSNLLVGSNGKAKLSDFGFSFSVDNPAETSPPRQSTATRWKAPELFGAQNSVPSFKSDIYSLGMCILEAVRGEPPWGRLLPDKIIIDKATSGELARPSDLNDKQWQLVKAMCERRPETRAALSTVINTLQELAKEGDTAGSQSVKSCRKCGTANPAKNKFCNECGTPFQLQTKAASSSLASAGT